MTEQVELYRELQEKHIRLRTIHEGYVAEFAKNIARADKAILDKLDLPDHELTLKEFIPEYYKEEPSQKAFQEQRYRYNKLVEQWNAAVDENVQEKVKCLSELEQVYGVK